ncbi:MAG: T9SS type A sorting domain-containing protein, partial [Bacteroidia bacterium]
SYNNIPVPGFDGATNTYDIVLDYGTTDIPVLTWTLSDPNASAEATDLSAFPGASTVTVTAEDGTTENIYTINFSVSATMSSDATLKEIRINGELLPGFDPSVYEYQYALPFGTTGPAVISAVANSLVATVSYSQPGSATSLGGVTVTAQNGTESQYAIFFSINPYIYTVGWETASLPFDGWSTENTIISTNFGTEPITNHGDFPGVYAFRFICGKAASGSVSGSLTTSMYPKSGVLKFWLYVQLPDGNEGMTISKHVKGATDPVVVATLSAAEMASANWKEFSFNINETDSTRIIFTSSLTLDGTTSIWIDDVSLKGMVSTGIFGNRMDEANILIYPNPVSDYLNIQIFEQGFDNLEIYNLFGVRVHSRKITDSNISLDVSEYDKGIYIITFTGDNKRYSTRIIKL